MIIGVDMDEVIADFLPAFMAYHNHTHGTTFTKDIFSYKFWDVLGITREEATRRIYDFHKTQYFRDIQPIPGAQEATKILSKDHELIIVTARQNDIIEETIGWVAQYFPDRFSNIFFANHFSKNGESSRSKKEICDSAGIEVLVEDNADYARECLTPKRKVILYNQPWNRNAELPKEIPRVDSWQEIVDLMAA